MTEEEWQECTDPDRMLAWLEDSASQRKLRLLCCACCRRVWHLLETEALRQAVDTFERFAEGEIGEEVFRAAARTTHPLMNYREELGSGRLREEFWIAAYAVNAAMFRYQSSYRKALEFFAYAARPRLEEERAAHVDLIHEVFGNPFRPAAVPSACLYWGEGIIVKLATVIYDERSLPAGILDASRLGVLADALEESGWTDADILGHLAGRVLTFAAASYWTSWSERSEP
jgi:hypothetical protein